MKPDRCSPAHLLALALALAVALVAPGCMNPDDPGSLVPPTVDEDPSLPHIDVHGTRLHAETYGDPSAPMIMVLHGGPGGDYRSLLPYRVPTSCTSPQGSRASPGSTTTRGTRRPSGDLAPCARRAPTHHGARVAVRPGLLDARRERTAAAVAPLPRSSR